MGKGRDGWMDVEWMDVGWMDVVPAGPAGTKIVLENLVQNLPLHRNLPITPLENLVQNLPPHRNLPITPL